jgi:hypothetical protein
VIESDRPASTVGSSAAVMDYFEAYRCEPEAVFKVPALADDDQPLEIGIAAVGGGEVGRAYADNDWIYAVWLAGELVCSGVDLRSGGIAGTHRDMAAVLAEYVSDSEDAPPALRRYTERLTDWTYESAHRRDGGCEAR